MRYFRVRRSDGVRVALIVALLAGALAAGRSPRVDAADSPSPPVTVTLAGSHLMSPLVAAWAGELITKDASARIGYTQGNALTGRKGLLAGNADAALSATPLQIDDLARIEELKAAGQNPDFVTVPLNASALLFAELRPLAALIPLDVAGSPAVDVPPGPVNGYSMADAIRFYMEPPNLRDAQYATLHGYSVYNPLCPTPCPEEWEPPPPKLGDVSAPSGSIEIPARTGPSAMGWMLERIMKERAPDLWARYLGGIKRPTDTVSEQIAIPFTFNGSEANRWASKFYPAMLDAMLEFASRGVRPCCFFGGLPPWVIQQYRYGVLDLLKLDRTVQAHLDRWELRPLVIDGVAPTPVSIAQALVDGDGLSSTEAKIPDLHGGYPASFVNKMIVRTDTLKPEKVNAMVDLITYMVTEGQVHAVELGDPALPRFHVQRALEGANQIVTKACPTNRIIDGASIALIHAGAGKWPVRGLVLMAPHVFVEDITVQSIEAAKVAFDSTDLPAKLGRYHDDVQSTFRGWNDIWLNPSFRHWNIEEYLSGIDCPLLAIQGENDNYGSHAQIDSIRNQVPGSVRTLMLPECGHSPHVDQGDATLRAIKEFVASLPVVL